MSSRFTLKDHFHENRLVNARLLFAAFFSLLVFSVLVGRLVYLQVYESEHFQALSDRNRVDIEPLPPQRGLIFDRNGVIIAENVPTFSLELVPEKVPDLEETMARLTTLLSLSEADLEEFEKRFKGHRRFEQVAVRQRLTEEEVAIFSANRHAFPGVDIQGRLIRHYPHGPLFAHAVGYVGRINERDLETIDQQNYKGTLQIGKTGVEKFYEDLLHGQVGYRQVETNVQGRVVREIHSQLPIAGDNIYLNLDAKLQQIASDALTDYNGAVVAMHPKTGAVLALVSKPHFDPNLFVTGISIKDYSAYRDSPDRPLYDRALRGSYPPGSTLKPFMALAGLEENVVTEHSSTYCPGWYTLPGDDHRYRCWKKHGHGKVDLIQSMAQSCDVYFYDLAHALTIDRMHDFLDHFNFGRKTQIDLPSESSGLLPSRSWKRGSRNQPWYPGETLIAGIGQGFNQTTPLQLAQATSILAMRGVAQPPHIVKATRNAGDNVMRLFGTDNVESLPMQNSRHWEAVIESMVEVVHGKRGTARHIAEHFPFKVAGKTGTAQVFGIAQDEEYDAETLAKKLHDHALFIAFAPADDPEFVVAVVAENGGSGSKTAAPIAGKMIEAYFGIEPDEPEPTE
jgi:penicillin-binding protein 2